MNPAPSHTQKTSSPGALWFLVPVGLLLGLWLLPPPWHLALGLGAWLALRLGAKDLLRSLGRPSRWMLLLLIFALLGGFFGPSDITFVSISWSLKGSLAAVTMLVRALALLLLGSLISAIVPLRAFFRSVPNPLLRQLGGVVIMAANFVPALLQIILEARTTLGERRPGILMFRHRLELLAIHIAVRAAQLAREVAFDMTLAEHNALVCATTQPREDV